MILYYAVGGGLGHLTRGRRVLQALGMQHDAAFVTASPYARDSRVTGGIEVIEVPAYLEHTPLEHHEWMRELIRERAPERLVADAFPAGIQGELCDLDVPMDHVARILRELPERSPRFATTWIVEELTPEHDVFLRAHSDRVVSLELPIETFEDEEASRPFWLIVHSGPEEEVSELIAYAATLRDLASDPPSQILIATRNPPPSLPSGFALTDVDPPARLFASATRILSAAGFNVMLETAPFAHKHVVVPFPRRFDDQFLRASRRRT